MVDTLRYATELPDLGRPRRRRRRRSSGAYVLLAAAFVVGGLVVSCPEQGRPARPGADAATISAPVAAPVTARADRVTGASSPRPAALAIRAIDVRTDLVGLGLEEDLTVEVPDNADRAGWYELGTVPGRPGSAVILGHVDSTDGPAVFHRLHELEPGSRVEVVLADGTLETFEVTRVETVANSDFPAEKVYAGTPTRPTLAIVTCGGEYDADNGGYQSNVIAYTEHVGTTPAA